jgi:hypothetical protein
MRAGQRSPARIKTNREVTHMDLTKSVYIVHASGGDLHVDRDTGEILKREDSSNPQIVRFDVEQMRSAEEVLIESGEADILDCAFWYRLPGDTEERYEGPARNAKTGEWL